MPIVTLTSDYGHRDPFVAALRGTLLRAIPGVHIEDISHEILPFHLAQAAYVIGEAFPYFPEGSMHFVSVKEGHSHQTASLLMYKQGHYFMAPDNGVLTLIHPDVQAEWIIQLHLPQRASLFPARDLYVNAAAHLFQGGTPDVLGKSATDIVSPGHSRAHFDDKLARIKGNVIHIDRFGNLVSNIPGKMIEEYRNGRDFRIVTNRTRPVRLCSYYNKVSEGNTAAIINCSGMLEIGLSRTPGPEYNGASQLLGIYLRDPIEVHFS